MRRGNRLRPMRTLFPTARVVAAVGVWLAAAPLCPALAQDPEQWLSPPNDLSRAGHGETYSLDTLFAGLKIAPDETSAKAIEPDAVFAADRLIAGTDTLP